MAEKAAEFKEKGNAAFAAKDWNLAIDFYTKAIQADATNHVFWSNRSACYINTGEYAKAKDDAKKCMEVNPAFIKGYYRMVAAQMGEKDYEGAIKTAKAGMAVDKGNAELQKQVRTAKGRLAAIAEKKKAKNAVSNSGRVGEAGSFRDQQVAKEMLEIQDEYMKTVREIRETTQTRESAKKEARLAELAWNELSSGEYKDAKLYKGFGKMFVRSTLEEIEKTNIEDKENYTKRAIDADKRLAHLEKKLKSTEEVFDEVRKQSQAAEQR